MLGLGRKHDPMTADQKRELTARGAICRPVDWSRRSRRDVLRARRRARERGAAA